MEEITVNNFKIPYSKEIIDVNFPEIDNLKVLKPSFHDFEKSSNQNDIIDASIKNPIEKNSLRKIINPDYKKAIIIDDITRPTPTKSILNYLLNLIKSYGISNSNINLIFALGTHGKMTREEIVAILGKDIIENYEIMQHDCNNTKDLVKIKSGHDINKWVVNADLRIAIGMIKSHRIAGYSGGAKSILPGVAGFNTILNNHSYEKLSNKNCAAGIINKNPTREDMEIAAKELEPLFIINVILNPKNEIVSVVSGDVIKAHRRGTEIYDRFCKIAVEEKREVVVVSCPYPSDKNFYQTLYNSSVVVKVRNSVLKKNGVLIMIGDCENGIGESNFAKMITKHKSPDKLLSLISKPGYHEKGQWAVQNWADILKYCKVILVNKNNLPDKLYQNTHLHHSNTIEKAWNKAKTLLGKNKLEGYIIPNIPYTMPIKSNNKSEL